MRPKSLHSFCLLALLCLPAFAQEKYPIDSPLPGPSSPYTGFVLELLRSWPPKTLGFSDLHPGEVKIRAIEAPGNAFYVGAEQRMKIHAPLARVEAVLDAFDQYQEIFPDYQDVHVVSTDGNKILTAWEEKVPFFLVPNVKYRITYLVDKSSPVRKIYRYKLESSDDLKADDGLIVIEAEGASAARYAEYDFFDAHWGIAKILAPQRIWKDSMEGLFVSDEAILLKAEHPDWKNSKVLEESKKALDRFPTDNVLKNKTVLLKQ